MVGKKELVNRIAEEGFTKVQADKFLNALSVAVIEFLEDGEAVKIGSIVTLEPVHVEEAERRNPATQEVVIVEAHNKVMAKVSETVKNRVW